MGQTAETVQIWNDQLAAGKSNESIVKWITDEQAGLHNKAPSAPSAPSAPVAPTVAPTVAPRKNWTDYVTPDMDMTTQMGQYTSEDSPLMIAAETAGKRQQNSLGLLNTQGTVSAVQNNMFNAALPVATADVDRATVVALDKMGDDLQRDVVAANITASNQQMMAKIWGDLVNTQVATMGAGINDGSWTQTGQTNIENVINASGSAFSGFLGVPLS